MSLLQILGFVGVCLGTVLFLLAMRGRRVDNHPLCAECDFDLTGRAKGSKRCPECGADLSQRLAIVYGHRKPYRGWMAVTGGWVVLCLLLVATPLVLGLLNAAPAGQRDLMRLFGQLASVDTKTRNNAFTELRSATMHEPSQQLMREHAAKLMNLTGPLTPDELWFIHYLFIRDLLDVMDYERFLFRRYAPQVVTVPSARPADLLPVQVNLPGDTPQWSQGLSMHQNQVQLSVDRAYSPDITLRAVTLEVLDSGLPAVQRTPDRALLKSPVPHLLPLILPLPQPEKPGDRPLEAGQTGRMRIALHLDYTVGPHTLTREFESWHTVEWLDARAEVLRPVHDPFVQGRVHSSLRASIHRTGRAGAMEMIGVIVEVEGRLVESVAGQAFLMYGGSRLPLGPIWLAADPDGVQGHPKHWTFVRPIPPVEGDSSTEATLEIVPDATVAGQYVHTRRYLDMGLHIPVRQVQLQFMPPPATTRAAPTP